MPVSTKFRTYIPCYAWIYPFFFVASIFVYLHSIYAVLLVVPNLVFFVIYIQHLIVNISTMRFVLLQPDLPDNHTVFQCNNNNNYCNRHLEITYAEYQAWYANTRTEEEIGIIKISGKIQLQVLSQSTKKRLQRCVFCSRVYLIISGLMVLYCLSWAIGLFLTCGLCGISHFFDAAEDYDVIAMIYYTFSCFILSCLELGLAVCVCCDNLGYICRAFGTYCDDC